MELGSTESHAVCEQAGPAPVASRPAGEGNGVSYGTGGAKRRPPVGGFA